MALERSARPVRLVIASALTATALGFLIACNDGDDDLVGEETCADIEQAYAQLIDENRSCNDVADCRVLFGQCGVGLGGCHEATDQSVTQAQLDDLGRRFANGGCTTAVCDCLGPPDIDCVDDVCTLMY